jgi:hypothetical protein
MGGDAGRFIRFVRERGGDCKVASIYTVTYT